MPNGNMKSRAGQMLNGIRNRHFFAFDILALLVAPFLALGLRADDPAMLMRFFDATVTFALISCVVSLPVFYLFGLYSRFWRYASVDELGLIIVAVSTAALAAGFVFFVIPLFVRIAPPPIPRSVPIVNAILVLFMVGGVRFSARFVGRMEQRQRHPEGSTSRVAIIGAGDAGSMIVKEMRANPQLGLEPILFFDDDPRKWGTFIHGVRVAGGRETIKAALEQYHIRQVVIAMPTAPGKIIRELTQVCQEADVPVMTMPGLFEVLGGSVTVSKLRPVEITDLLRREPVETDTTAVADLLRGKRVMVTGAGGSIGSELCRQIAWSEPARLILLGHGENSLFEIGNELRRTFANLCLTTVLGDVRDLDRLNVIFDRYPIDVVFHAGAHKHVPLVEANIEDAITNNVLGTRNILEVASRTGVKYFVLISTDKAVNPSSIMGATKRVAELLVADTAHRTGHHYVAVRFGNVLGSRGSVVPVFKQQIARGGPVTVTDPEVRRYFMTIPEAVQLVLQAGTFGKGGEVFVLDMGEPIKIVDLARDLIRLSGLVEGQEIDIVFTGLRPGEKLFEELFVGGERHARTIHNKIFVAENGNQNTSQFSGLDAKVNALLAAARSGDEAEIRRLLLTIVPEYSPPRKNFPSVDSTNSTSQSDRLVDSAPLGVKSSNDASAKSKSTNPILVVNPQYK